MTAPTFVDLQGFIVGRNFVVKEAAILRKGSILSHYIFTCPEPWHMLTKSERSQVLWLMKNHHGLSWNDGHVSYWKSKRLITTAVMGASKEDDASSLVYVKGHEKRQWLADILDDARNDVVIETLDADYDDVASLNKLDVKNTMRCENHVKNCALQNVFKIYNWWLKHYDSSNPYL